MTKKIVRLAVIPARGGSKRIKNKNLKNFCGQPIIKYTIDNVTQSKMFNKIHISTESKKIFNYVSKLGLKPEFYRSKSLSKDNTPIFAVLYEVYRKYLNLNIHFDEIWLITPTSPLVDSSDYKGVSSFIKKNNFKKPILSVSNFTIPIEWAFIKNKKNILTPVEKTNQKKRSQVFSTKFFDTGSFAIFKPQHLKNSNGKFYNGKFVGYTLSFFKSIDIDDLNDWEIAEKIYKSKIHK